MYWNTTRNSFKANFFKRTLLFASILTAGVFGKVNLVIAQAPVNDNACSATQINVGFNSPFTNVNATVQSGEPAIPSGSCTSQLSWCSSDGPPQHENTVWFKFTVPPTGTGSYAFRVNGNAGGFDSQVAIFRANSCADVTNGNAVLLAANDDSAGTPFNSYMTVFCLTPTVTYYVMVDGYNGTTNANFYVHVIQLSDANAVANAGADITTCPSLDPQINVNGSILGVAGSTTWTTIGDGTFANSSALSTTYTPGSNDKNLGQTKLILSTNDPVGVCTASRDTLVLTLLVDSISAGIDKTICNTDQYIQMTASSFQFTSYLWTTLGDGTFDNVASLSAKYFPGPADKLATSVKLVLRGVSTQCFNTVYDTLTLFNTGTGGAQINVGADRNACFSDSILISGVVASNYSILSWTTSGNGHFNNTASLNPYYTPGTSDIIAGSVTLTLTGQSVSPCQGSFSDSFILTIQRKPQINSIAGGGSYCANQTVSLSGSVQFQSSVLWQTNGDGNFTSPNNVNTTYNPGPNDLLGGSIKLYLTANAIAPCSVAKLDSTTISIQPVPVISIDVPSISCAFESISLKATISNYNNVIWSTNGDGTFDDEFSTSPKYTPGVLDVAAGSVQFTISVFGISPCNVFTVNGSTQIIPEPGVNAGPDDSVCVFTTVTVTASATSASGVIWSTSGDGFFLDPSALSTIYIPGVLDYDNGSVSLFLEGSPLAPCFATATDGLVITFVPYATADAGDDIDIVAGQNAQLNGFTQNDAQHYWITLGDGTFDNDTSLNAVYTPGTNDVSDGIVTLGLIAIYIDPCTPSTIDYVDVSIFSDALLAVKFFAEGFYSGGQLQPVLFNSGVSTNTGIFDYCIFSLHQNSSPYNIVYQDSVPVATNGVGFLTIPAAFSNSTYYLSVRHRNSIEVWSKQPIFINAFGLYDFSD